MKSEAQDDVLEAFEKLRREDPEYAAVSARFAPLASFLVEYEYLKGIQGITQAELAARMATTQSAISRFESMRHPPSYDLLINASRALGDELFMSPTGSASICLPCDLREAAQAEARRRHISVQDLMYALIREGLTGKKAPAKKQSEKGAL